MVIFPKLISAAHIPSFSLKVLYDHFPKINISCPSTPVSTYLVTGGHIGQHLGPQTWPLHYSMSEVFPEQMSEKSVLQGQQSDDL